MTRVYNLHHGNSSPGAVYIGRPTIVGNPYTHISPKATKPGLATVVVESREKAIELYRKYFYESLGANQEFRDFVMGLKGHDLICWCAPKPCHGDVIAEYLDSL